MILKNGLDLEEMKKRETQNPDYKKIVRGAYAEGAIVSIVIVVVNVLFIWYYCH